MYLLVLSPVPESRCPPKSDRENKWLNVSFCSSAVLGSYVQAPPGAQFLQNWSPGAPQPAPKLCSSSCFVHAGTSIVRRPSLSNSTPGSLGVLGLDSVYEVPNSVLPPVPFPGSCWVTLCPGHHFVPGPDRTTLLIYCSSSTIVL